MSYPENNYDPSESSLNVKPGILTLLAYVFWWVGGLIVFVAEKRSYFVRFHALQATILALAITVTSAVLGVIPFAGGILRAVLSFGGWMVLILCGIKSYNGQWFELPFIGEFCRVNAKPRS